jgi:pimeloyl-ACP methyl ester carboxylesterase
MMAAALRPERVRALVLLEPVMIPRAWAVLERLAWATGRNPGPNLADRAALRRSSFPSFEAAHASYTGRGAFRSWPDEMLRDYLEGGLVKDANTGAMHLACKPSWEAATFRATPFGVARLVRRIACPIVAMKGTIGSTCAASEAEILERAGARIVTIDGASHFLPMEHPQRVRDEIVRLADRL